MRAFFEMKILMSLNNPTSIDYYWPINNFISNQGVKNGMTKPRFKEMLRSIELSDKNTTGSNTRGNKVRPLIDYFNEAFQNAMPYSSEESIDEHRIKFKQKSSMKQYIKTKLIKWRFTLLLYCKLDIYIRAWHVFKTHRMWWWWWRWWRLSWLKIQVMLAPVYSLIFRRLHLATLCFWSTQSQCSAICWF